MGSICTDQDRSVNPCKHYEKKYRFCHLSKHGRCINYIYNKGPILSNSAIEKYGCRLAFWFSYIKLIEPLQPSLPMITGNVAHALIEDVHDINPNYDKTIKLVKSNVDKLNRGKDDDDWDIPQDILNVYPFRDAYRETEFANIKGETEVTAESQELGIKTKYDLLYNDRKDILEFKYAKSDEWYSFFTTRTQAGIELLLNPEAQKITFRIMIKPQLKKGKNETDDEFSDRIKRDILRNPKKYIIDKTFWRNEYEFAEIKWFLWELRREIQNKIAGGRKAFFPNTKACWNIYGPCEYLQICESKVISRDLYIKSYEYHERNDK